MKRRQIYRAYDTKNKRLLNYNAMTQRGILLRPDGIWVNAQDCVIMQFSGRLDARKVPIYEGDICEVSIPTDFGSYMKYTGIMTWVDNSAGFTVIVPKSGNNIFGKGGQFPAVDPTIIGNTIDSPDLLKQLEDNAKQEA